MTELVANLFFPSPGEKLLASGGWLKWLVGNNPDVAGKPQLHWANLPESWGTFVFIALVALVATMVFWLYRREIGTCPAPIKILMGFLRLAVLLFLIALLLKPSVFYQQVDEQKPVVTMVRDASLSFARGDQYQDEELVDRLAATTGIDADKIRDGSVLRSELLNAAIARQQQAVVTAIRDKGSLSVVDFSDGLEPVAIIPAFVESTLDDPATSDQEEDPVAPGSSEPEDSDEEEKATENLIRESVPPLRAEGLGSDIAQALRQTLKTTRLSSIILVSDGQNTTSEDPVEIAKLAAEQDIPIFVVGVGDANPPKNLAVTKVFTPKVAFPDEQFEIDALIQALSLSEEDPLPPKIDIELIQHRVDPDTGEIDGEPLSLGVKSFDLPADRRGFKAVFSHTMNTPGHFRFSVRVPQLENEVKTDDNLRTSKIVEVADKKYRVLLVSGLPNWDYQQVYRFLQRDQTVILSCWLQSMDESRVQEGNEPIAYLPRTIDELSQYNVIMLIDPNPEEFDEEWIRLLEQFCRIKAGGVLYMAGPHYTTEFITMNRLQGVRNLLPVRFGDVDYIGISQDLAEARADNAGRMLIVPSKLEHPVMAFDAERDKSAAIWAMLPNVLWNFPTIAAKPTAEVLIERGDTVNQEGNQPLLVSGRYGAGTVLYFGFHGTWRWRSAGLQAEYFDDFWMQVVRHLFQNHSMQGASRGRIETDMENYDLGKKVPFYVEVRDDQLKGLTQPTIQAHISDEGGRIIPLVLQREPGQETPETNEGRYRGAWTATRLGSFRISVDIGPDSEQLIAPIWFNVVAPSVEANQFWLNQKQLRGIAEQSGGKYFTLDELDQLPDALPTLSKRVEFNSPSQPIWDLSQTARILAFLLPLVLLATEWALRKWHKLL